MKVEGDPLPLIEDRRSECGRPVGRNLSQGPDQQRKVGGEAKRIAGGHPVGEDGREQEIVDSCEDGECRGEGKPCQQLVAAVLSASREADGPDCKQHDRDRLHGQQPGGAADGRCPGVLGGRHRIDSGREPAGGEPEDDDGDYGDRYGSGGIGEAAVWATKPPRRDQRRGGERHSSEQLGRQWNPDDAWIGPVEGRGDRPGQVGEREQGQRREQDELADKRVLPQPPVEDERDQQRDQARGCLEDHVRLRAAIREAELVDGRDDQRRGEKGAGDDQK